MIPLMKHTFLREGQTKEALVNFLRTQDRFSMGNECLKFEKSFAEFQGRKFGILFNSGGSANLALLQALKNLKMIQNGDMVGFSALTWSTNVMPIIQLGLEPIPVDCDPHYLNATSETLALRLQTNHLRAFFITNALGFLGDLNKIRDLCLEKNILLIEDNCESLGTELRGTKAGNFGLASTFSFFVAHHMSTVEGGMICTDDPDLADMLKMVRANGWDRNLSALKQKELRTTHSIPSEFEAKYAFYELGFNFRPTEITGFLGNIQLAYLPENIQKREQNHIFFESLIQKNSQLRVIQRSHLSRCSAFCLPILTTKKDFKEKYKRKFGDSGIEIRPMIAGNIQNQPFYRRYQAKRFELPGTTEIDECGFYCGNYPELDDADLQCIASCLL
jgi:CDP-6-deoxy-D-xylo-4-hexulose-3-dehydrase